ncbi:MAG: amino acid adenylation domain-containing protein [Halanaerobiales bacterium]
MMIYIRLFYEIDDISIGIPIYNRRGKKEKETIGMFVSTVPIRMKIDHKNTFLEICQELAREHKNSFRHQRYPYNLLLSELKKKHKFSYNPLGISVSYQNSKILRDDCPFDFDTRWIFNDNIIETFSLHLEDRDDRGIFLLKIDYLSDLFTKNEVADIYKRLMIFLFQGINEDKKIIAEMEIVDQKEKNLLLNKYNQTSYTHSSKSFIRLFEEQQKKSPENIALIYKNKSITYREVNRKANILARVLINNGVSSNKIVALLTKKSIDMIIAILAIYKVGGAYLPIGPYCPLARIKYMIKDSQVDILITDSENTDLEILETLADFEIVIIDLSKINYKQEDENITLKSDKNDLAYLIYTSGTTGNPKAVLVDNTNLSNYIFAFLKEFKLNQEDRFLHQSSISFDASVEEIFPILTVGGAVVIVEKETVLNIKNLVELINRNQVTYISCSPYLLNQINKLNYEFPGITFISGGDILKAEYISNFTNARVYNTYGPTEATVCTSYYYLENLDKHSIPIGKPITNYQVYILNQNNQLLPPGYVGELCISGKGISRGYLNRKELTASKFIINPFFKDKVMYKSGDLARWLEDGNLEYCGRLDNQVKIRGFRIEIEEIEKTIESYDGIIRSVVVINENDSGLKKIIAYFLSCQNIDLDHLRYFLKIYLPEYMIPLHFLKMETFPLTDSGKVNKNLLPEPDLDKLRRKKFQYPESELEKKLSYILSELFSIDKISIYDNFFDDLGGDSLLAIEIQIMCEKQGLNLHLQDIFQFPSIRQLALRVEERSNLENDDKDEDKAKEKEKNLSDIILHKPVAFESKQDIEVILLTGASGFFGAHILAQIIKETEAKVLCLLRNKDSFIKSLDYYFSSKQIKKIIKRITIINGDIEKDNFGIEINKYREIQGLIDTVIHAAANSNHFGLWKNFYKSNVMGTKEIIKFCIKANAVLHHISTIGISGEGILPQQYHKPIFSEETVYIGQDYKSNVYIHSKYLAELEVLSALKKGLRACIYRIGNLMWRDRDGIFQKNYQDNGFISRINSLKKLKVIPADLLNQKIDLTAVDLCAEAFLKLMRYSSRSEIYHLFNYNKVEYSTLFRLLGLDIKSVEVEEFLNRVLNNKYEKDIAVLYLYLNQIKDYIDSLEVDIKYEKTKNILKSQGFSWNIITNKYLEKTDLLLL